MLDTECMGTYFMGRSRKWKERNEAVSRERMERKAVSAEDICEIQGNDSIANANEKDPAEKMYHSTKGDHSGALSLDRRHSE